MGGLSVGGWGAGSVGRRLGDLTVGGTSLVPGVALSNSLGIVWEASSLWALILIIYSLSLCHL